jgi:hypothetical protein
VSGGVGGAIFNFGFTTITASTFSNNSAGTGGSIFNNAGTLTIGSSIIADSPSGGNCFNYSAGGAILTDGGYNLTDDATCGFTNGTNHDLVVGAGQAGLAAQLASNGGPTQTVALLSGSPAIGAGDPSACGPSGLLANLDQRGYPRNADTRSACDIGAYDTGGPIAIAKGWNLIGIPTQSSTTATASGLLGSLNGASALGANAVTALATYTHGRFALYVRNYTSDQSLSPAQGVFILSSKAGSWMSPGTAAYASGQPVNLQPGWNLEAAPFPYAGLNGDSISGEIGTACGLQEIATYTGGSYQVYMPSGGPAGAGFHVPITDGMWIECTNTYTWTPS